MSKLLLRLVTASFYIASFLSTFQSSTKYSSALTIESTKPDSTSLVLFFNSSKITLEPISAGLDNIFNITSPYSVIDVPTSTPEFPYLVKTIQIPPVTVLSYEVLSEDIEKMNGVKLAVNHRAINHAVDISDNSIPGVSEGITSQHSLITIQEVDGWLPAEPIVIRDYWIRNQHLAQIYYFPVQYNQSTGQVILRNFISIKINFTNTKDESGILEGNWYDDQPGFNSVENTNPDWQGYPTGVVSQNYQAAMSVAGIPRIKISIDHDGIYKITGADLVALGMDLTSINPRNLALSSQGRDVAIVVVGEEDGVFYAQDYIIFYGEALNGEYLASKYASEADNWVTFPNGWKPQMTADWFEKYTDKNIYWLFEKETPGLRMENLSLLPVSNFLVAQNYWTTVQVENQRNWWPYHFTSEDNWLDNPVRTSIREMTYTIEISAIADEDFSPQVHGELVPRDHNAMLPNDHHTLLKINKGTPYEAAVEDAYWDGLVRHEFLAQIPKTALLEGQNGLFLRLQEDSRSTRINLDWFEISYLRKYQSANEQIQFTDHIGDWQYSINGFSIDSGVWIMDTSNSTNPILIQNAFISNGSAKFERSATTLHSYYAASQAGLQSPVDITFYNPPDLLSSSNGADYIIITHNTFLSDADRLAQDRQSKGMRTRVVDIDDIYNEFGDGIYHPVAIKNFLSYTFLNWQQPPPSYVLLVGDGNFNMVNSPVYTATPIYMPPYLGWVDYTVGETDNANSIASIVGEDYLPDLVVSRIPVNSAAEFAAVVDRIIAYEAGSYTETWRTRGLMVADNVPDAAGDFVGVSNALINDVLTPNGINSDTIYLNDYANNGATARQAYIDYLNTEGAGFVSYVGHGSTSQWAGEKLFHNDYIPLLTNSIKLPVVLSMTCMDGTWFYTSDYNTGMAEELVRSRNGTTGEPRGAIAAWASTGWGTVIDHDALERGFLESLLMDKSRLGNATLAGKLSLFLTGSGKDVLQTFTLFGDPALKIIDSPDALPPAPTDVQASDGSFTDRIRVTWNPPFGANTYQIFRSLSADGSDRTQVGASVTPLFEDTSVDANIPHYFWIKAVNPSGISDFSLADSGYRNNIPLAPSNVQASDGVYLAKIAISWNPSPGAVRYDVYRKVNSDSADPIKIGETASSTFEDFPESELVLYEYSIRAINGYGESEPSVSDVGYRASVSSLPGAPLNVQASDAEYPDKVFVTWNAVDNATGYEIYRNIYADGNLPEKIGDSTLAQYEDTTALGGILYEYRVKAVNSLGPSPFSLPDVGNVLEPPETPGNLTATDGLFWDRILVTWNETETTTHYEIYRAPAFGEFTLITTVDFPYYEDFQVDSGTIYQYKVLAINQAGGSAFTVAESGYASIPIFLPVVIH